jgi:hypothetical protein
VFSCACDHPQNLFVEFDTINGSFSDYNMMVLKTILYTPPAPRPWPTEAGPWPTEHTLYPKSRRSH